MGLCPTRPVTAAGWRIEPPVSVPIAHGARPPATAARRAAGGAARDAVEVPRVAGDAVGGVLRGGAHRELVHVGLAEQHGAGGLQPGGDGGVVRRPPALEDLRAARGRHALGDDDVLERERDAGQRAERPPPARAASTSAAARQRGLGVDVQVGAERAVLGGDPVEVGLGDLDGASTSPAVSSRPQLGGVSAGRVGCRRGRHASSPRMRGTRNRPSSAAGAPASTTSRGRLGRATSWRGDVGQRHRVRGRRHVARRRPAHLGDRVEDGVELAGEEVELLVGHRQPRQPRQVGDLVAGQWSFRDGVLMLGRNSTSQVLAGAATAVCGRVRDLRHSYVGGLRHRSVDRERLPPQRSTEILDPAADPAADRRRSRRNRVLSPAPGRARPARHPRRGRDRARHAPASTSCPLDVLERGNGVAVDDVVVELPADRLPDSLITAAQSVPGVPVESLRPFAGPLDTHRELELLDALAQAGARTRAAQAAGRRAAAGVPQRLGGGPRRRRGDGWRGGGRRPRPRPSFDGLSCRGCRCTGPRLLPSEDDWLPERWREMAIEMMAAPYGGPGLRGGARPLRRPGVPPLGAAAAGAPAPASRRPSPTCRRSERLSGPWRALARA